MRRRQPKNRNPYARELEDPKFRPKRIGSRKDYNRGRHKREVRRELIESEQYRDDD